MSRKDICQLYYHIRGVHRLVTGSDNTKCNCPTKEILQKGLN
jgi:hypothetical protein